MKAAILAIGLMFGLVSAAMACPNGFYTCGQTGKLCCPY